MGRGTGVEGTQGGTRLGSDRKRESYFARSRELKELFSHLLGWVHPRPPTDP